MTFTIDNDNNISAYGTPEEAAAESTTPFDSFSSQEELAELAKAWPADRFVAIWNSLPGVTPVQRFTDRNTAVGRIWKRIQDLGAHEQPQAEQPAKPKAERKAKGGARAAKGASAKGKANTKATAAQNVPKGKKGREDAGDSGAARRHQDCHGGGPAPAEKRRHAGRDPGKDGLAGSHCPRFHGWRLEESGTHRRVLQIGQRRAHLPHQQIALQAPLPPARLAAAGFFCFRRSDS